VEKPARRRIGPAPQRAHDWHRLARSRAALGERDLASRELLRKFAPDADTEHQPPAAQPVERRGLLGDVRRVAQRQ